MFENVSHLNLDWALTLQVAKQYIVDLENIVGQLAQRHEALEKRTDTLETRLKQNSQNWIGRCSSTLSFLSL